MVAGVVAVAGVVGAIVAGLAESARPPSAMTALPGTLPAEVAELGRRPWLGVITCTEANEEALARRSHWPASYDAATPAIPAFCAEDAPIAVAVALAMLIVTTPRSSIPADVIPADVIPPNPTIARDTTPELSGPDGPGGVGAARDSVTMVVALTRSHSRSRKASDRDRMGSSHSTR